MATEPSEVSITATVKWFDRKKGFGFATPEGGDEDIFIHQRNIVADGKSPVLDEGDTIYYKLGEHNGRATAIDIRLPVGHTPSFEKRRRRGRNAKKEADAEAEADEKAAEEKAMDAQASAPAANGDAKKEPRLGPDGKPWRKDSRTRTRRNDKGAKPAGQRDGQASARRLEKKAEVNQAAKDSAGAAEA